MKELKMLNLRRRRGGEEVEKRRRRGGEEAEKCPQCGLRCQVSGLS